MSGNIRTDIWNGMVEADRLARYYGQLAGKLASQERWMAIATTGLAMVSVAVAATGHMVGTLVATAATVVASAASLPGGKTGSPSPAPREGPDERFGICSYNAYYVKLYKSQCGIAARQVENVVSPLPPCPPCLRGPRPPWAWVAVGLGWPA